MRGEGKPTSQLSGQHQRETDWIDLEHSRKWEVMSGAQEDRVELINQSRTCKVIIVKGSENTKKWAW